MFVSGPDYLSLPRNSHTWIVEDLLPTGGFLNIFGNPKSGKSFLALQMASCINDATKEDFLGFPVHLHGRVCYLQLDTPRSLWADRITNVATEGWGFADVCFADTELAPYPFDILGVSGNPESFKLLTESIAALQPVCVMIDTIREAHTGDEDKSSIMMPVVNKIKVACGSAAIVLISHARKGNPDHGTDLMKENRGSNYVAGRMDCVMKVSKKELMYEGRTIGERKLKATRTPCGMWKLDEDIANKTLHELVTKNPGMSQSELGRVGAELTGLSSGACRKRIQRITERIGEVIR